MPVLALVLLLALLLLLDTTISGSVATTATCDFRVVQETDYSAWNLAKIGISTNSSICVNGGYLRNPSCKGLPNDACFAEFVAVTPQQVLAAVKAHVVPVVAGRRRQQIVLDLEDSVRPDLFWAFDDAKLAKTVAGMKMRVRVLRSVFPDATLGIYGTPTPFHNLTASYAGPAAAYAAGKFLNDTNLNLTMSGYARASALGLFDDLDVSIPSLYLGPWEDPAKVTDLVMRAATAITRSTAGHAGIALPAAPYLSWMFYGGMHSAKIRCLVPAATMQQQIDALLHYPVERLSMIQFWEGHDASRALPSCDNSSGRDAWDMARWLDMGDFVPEVCKKHGIEASRSTRL